MGAFLLGIMSEHTEQVALFEWKEWMENKYPELSMLYAIPMGGLRDKKTAAKMVREGAQAGVLDVNLDVPSNGYHGARIELKIKGGSLSDEQKIWIERFEKYGYFTSVCYGWIEAAIVICDYLNIEPEGLDVWNLGN